MFDPLQLRFWGGNDPKIKLKIFKKKSESKLVDGIGIHVSRPNLVKIGRWQVAKKSSGFGD